MDSDRPDATHQDDNPWPIRPDAPVPPGVFVDPWDEPLDPNIIEPAEPVEPRAPQRIDET